MQSIGFLRNDAETQLFCDYLSLQSIDVDLLYSFQGQEIWIPDPEQFEAAKKLKAEFETNPNDPRYPEALLQEFRQEEERRRKRMKRADDYWGVPSYREVPLCALLLIVSILVSIWTNLGDTLSEPYRGRIMQLIYAERVPVTPDSPASPYYPVQIIQGQFWRLITPILLHFGPIHLLFNLYLLNGFGGLVEIRRGWVWMLLFVLVTASISNTFQYFFPTLFNIHPMNEHTPKIFGGLSGVIYALFGYLWMKTQFSPEPGLLIPMDLVGMLMIWLLLCMIGTFGNVANTAHVAGLLLGCIIGISPKVWRLIHKVVSH